MGKSTKSGKSAPDKLSKIGKKSGVTLTETELGQVAGGDVLMKHDRQVPIKNSLP